MTDRPIIFSAPMVQALLAGQKTMTRRLITRRNVTVLGETWAGKSHPWEGLRFAEATVRNRSPISGLPDPHIGVPFCHPADEPTPTDECGIYRIRPAIEAGDHLWVKETFVLENNWEYRCEFDPPNDRPIRAVKHPDGDYELIPHYRASEPEPHIVPNDLEDGFDDRTRWSSPLHMPRWASRLTLEVTAARIERLQAITESDVIAEGLRANGATWPVPGQDGLIGATASLAFQLLWQSLHGEDSWDENPFVVVISFKVHKYNIDTLTLARAAA